MQTFPPIAFIYGYRRWTPLSTDIGVGMEFERHEPEKSAAQFYQNLNERIEETNTSDDNNIRMQKFFQ